MKYRPKYNYIDRKSLDILNRYSNLDNLILIEHISIMDMGKPCIYFLFQGDELVYIGQSQKNPLSRIERHKKTKEFDSVKVLIFEDTELTLSDCERILINMNLPKYNIDNISLQLKGEINY